MWCWFQGGAFSSDSNHFACSNGNNPYPFTLFWFDSNTHVLLTKQSFTLCAYGGISSVGVSTDSKRVYGYDHHHQSHHTQHVKLWPWVLLILVRWIFLIEKTDVIAGILIVDLRRTRVSCFGSSHKYHHTNAGQVFCELHKKHPFAFFSCWVFFHSTWFIPKTSASTKWTVIGLLQQLMLMKHSGKQTLRKMDQHNRIGRQVSRGDVLLLSGWQHKNNRKLKTNHQKIKYSIH